MILNDEALRRGRERATKRFERPGWPMRRPSVDGEQHQPEGKSA